MKTEAQFQGRARLTARYISQSANGSEELNLYDEYLGRYSISRQVQVGGVASFDQPHLSLSKEGRMEPAWRHIRILYHKCEKRWQPGFGTGLCSGYLPAGDGVYPIFHAAF